jgi:hypothetical protein
VPSDGHLTIDAYRLFLGMVFGALGLLTVAMAGIAIWLYRRNQRLPHVVWRGPGKYSPFDH